MVETRSSKMQRDSASTSSRPILGAGNPELPTSTITLTTATATATQAALSANSAQLNPIYDSTNPQREVESNITSPEYSSITAQNVRQEFRINTAANQQNIQTQARDVQNIIESAVGLRQVEMMRSMEDRLREIVPQIVAESLRSLSMGSGNQVPLQPTQPQFNQQPPPLSRGPPPNIYPTQTPVRPIFPSQPPPIRPDGQFNRSHSSQHMSNLPPPDNNSTI